VSAIQELEADLRTAATILEWESGDIFGHIGVRLPDGKGIACKAFRPISPEESDWLVHFDFDARKIGGSGSLPMEWPMYTEIFTARPDVAAIAHSHMPACIALSLAGREISPVHLQSVKFIKTIPTYPHPIHIKDRAEGGELAAALGDAKAVVIRGHGVVSVGASIDEACMNNLYLERTAKILGMAQSLGYTGPDAGFIEQMLGSRGTLTSGDKAYAHRTARRGYSNEWLYYRHKIDQGERWTRGWS